MLEVKDDLVLKLSPDFCLSKLEANKDMYWLLNTVTGDMYKLNETSFFTLSSFDGVKTVKEIKKGLLERYEENENVILKDFIDLIQFCLDKKFFK